MELPEGEYATVAGFVLDRLGHIPKAPGDVVEVEGWRLEVLALDRHAIARLRIAAVPSEGGDQADDEAAPDRAAGGR